MAARDSHEFRESVIDLGVFNFLYFGGDAILSGILANRAMKKHGIKAFKGISLTQPFKAFGRTFKVAVPYQKMYKLVSDRAHPAFKASRNIFWGGFLGSAAALAGFNMANFTYTRLKAEKQQAVFNRKLIQPLLNLMNTNANQQAASITGG